MSRSKRPRKRRRNASAPRKRGMMMGMRSGFKDVAGAATGRPSASRKARWIGTIITGVLIVLALLLLARRF